MMSESTQRERRQAGAPEGVALLAQTGGDQPILTDLPLDPLVFDPDVRRRGEFGGFFLANDAGAGKYLVQNAPEGAEWRRRLISPGRSIEGIHLPKTLRFALVAAGPLMKTGKPGQDLQFRFEAVVFCDRVIDRESGELALLRLAIGGVPAVKLHQFMVTDIQEALARLTERLRQAAQEAFDRGGLDRARLDAALANAATAQFIWLPISVKACQPVGNRTPTRGAVPYVDFMNRETGQRESMWTRIPTERLATPDDQGGLLLTGRVQAECQGRHAHYHQILRSRAEWKSRFTRTAILKP